MAEPIRATFRKPFSEQVAAFRLRLGNLVPTSAWDDLQHSAHDRGFMVAGAMKADLLADLGAAVDRAITEGTGIEAFRKDFRDIVTRHGWHGWTGEGTAKGEAWCTKVIYRTNMATSMAAGRWAQLVDGKFKYLIYQHSGAAHPRLNHLSWDGLVLPFDHAFWQTHYPPNGWGCGCKVRGAHTLAGARRVGGDPDKPLPDNWNSIDPKSGTLVGVGKGWDYAPGKSVAPVINTMTRKTVNWPFELAKAYMEALPTSVLDDFVTAYRSSPALADEIRRYVDRVLAKQRAPVKNGPSIQPYRTLGRLASGDVKKVGKLGFDADGYDYSISEYSIRHVFSRHGDPKTEASRGQRAITAADYARLALMLNNPASITADGAQILIEGVFGSERQVAVFDLLKKRRMLSLVSMRIFVRKAP